MASKDSAFDRVSNAGPEAAFARVEVAIVLMQGAGEAKGDRSLDGVLAENIPISFAITGRALFPFLWFVFPLIDASRQSSLHVAQRIFHRFQVEVVPLFLGHRLEGGSLSGSGHIEVVEEIIDALVDGT